MAIMKSFNGYEIYDEAARQQIAGVVTSGTGLEYVANVKGINELAVGTSFTMIPHVGSASTAPTLNVNGLGAKTIRRPLSNGSSTVIGSENNWLQANVPVHVMYNGSCWTVDLAMPDANDMHGILPVSSGGTGTNSLQTLRGTMGLGNTTGALPIANGGTGATNTKTALNNLGITWGTGEAPLKGTPNSIYIQIN